MTTDGEFIDYYSVLQIEPDCDTRQLEIAYRFLAKRYHPDHPGTADVAKFNEVIEAYRALRNPEDRAEYDQVHESFAQAPARGYYSPNDIPADQTAALNDAEIHGIVLRHLYQRRRENAAEPGEAPLIVQEMIDCSDDQFAFHLWYLKAKGLVESTERGTLAITIQGVDHVISVSRATKQERRRISQSPTSAEDKSDT